MRIEPEEFISHVVCLPILRKPHSAFAHDGRLADRVRTSEIGSNLEEKIKDEAVC